MTDRNQKVGPDREDYSIHDELPHVASPTALPADRHGVDAAERAPDITEADTLEFTPAEIAKARDLRRAFAEGPDPAEE
jgi:hypothetical protein